MTVHFVAQLITAGILFMLASPVWQAPTPTTSGASEPPLVSAAEAPAGTNLQGVQWVTVAAPGLGRMLAAVARPPGAGPFPTVVLLHGSHGFAEQYVRLAQDLARGGLLAMAPCWFAGGSGAGSRFVTSIGCTEAPPMPMASSQEARRIVDALVQAASALPDARPDRVALFGHSRGGGAALHSLFGASQVRAGILNSTGYPNELADRVSEIKTPLLMLHGTADSAADGGSAFTNVQMARNFEAALQRAGSTVEAKYYEGGEHNGVFASSTQYDDELKRMVAFLHRHLDR